MDIFSLPAIPRTIVGKSVVQLRKQGMIPAVIYGPGMENILVSISAQEFSALLKKISENAVIEIRIGEGSKATTHKVLIQETYRDPLSQQIDHIDFYRFSATKKVRVDVPVVLSGVAPAVADKGGVLLQNIDKIEVECLPDVIPQHFSVEIAGLADLNDTIYVKDLVMPKGVTCHLDPQTPIVSITEPEKEEVVPVEPVAPTEILTEAEQKRKEQEQQEAQEETAAE